MFRPSEPQSTTTLLPAAPSRALVRRPAPLNSRPCPHKPARGAGPSKPPSTPTSLGRCRRGEPSLTGLFPLSSSKPVRLLPCNGGVVRHAARAVIGTKTKRHEHQFSFPAVVQPSHLAVSVADRKRLIGSSTNPPRLFSHPRSCPRDSTTAHVASPVAPLHPFDRRLESLTDRGQTRPNYPPVAGTTPRHRPGNWFATMVGRMHVLERVRPRADSCKHFHRHPTPIVVIPLRGPLQGAKLRKRACLTSLPPKTSGSLIDSDGVCGRSS